jgi:hypothetical protein
VALFHFGFAHVDPRRPRRGSPPLRLITTVARTLRHFAFGDRRRHRTFGLLKNKGAIILGGLCEDRSKRGVDAFRGVANTSVTSAPREFSRPFLDETADAFRRVFRGLQPALLLLQLIRGDVRPFEYGFPGVSEGRRDRERGVLTFMGCLKKGAPAWSTGANLCTQSALDISRAGES